MPEDRWNEQVTLYPTDRWFAWLVPLIPRSVRPNHLTVLRIVLVPVVVFFLHQEMYAAAVPLFLFAAATDWLDGLLARTRRQITEWGVIYDPIADKLLVGAALFVIVLEHVNVTIGMLLLAAEIVAFFAGAVMRSRGRIEPANFWGKAKMLLEVVGIFLLLMALWLGIDLFVDLSAGTFALALIAALIAIIGHLR